MRRFHIATLPLLLLALLAAPLPAPAAGTCATEVLAAATGGAAIPWYSAGCYRRAARLVTPDVRAYSDAPQLITAAARRDRLRRLRVTVAKKAPASRLSIRFSPAVGSIRVSVFARKHGRFVLAGLGTLTGTNGTLRARLGSATRIRVSAGYVGSGDKPVAVLLTLTR
jgi:hypothetical protein